MRIELEMKKAKFGVQNVVCLMSDPTTISSRELRVVDNTFAVARAATEDRHHTNSIQHHCLLLILPLLSSLHAGELLHGGEEVDVLRQGICNRGLDHTRPVSDCGYPQTPCTHNTHARAHTASQA
jgi:hypothetical protein